MESGVRISIEIPSTEAAIQPETDFVSYWLVEIRVVSFYCMRTISCHEFSLKFLQRVLK